MACVMPQRNATPPCGGLPLTSAWQDPAGKEVRLNSFHSKPHNNGQEDCPCSGFLFQQWDSTTSCHTSSPNLHHLTRILVTGLHLLSNGVPVVHVHTPTCEEKKVLVTCMQLAATHRAMLSHWLRLVLEHMLQLASVAKREGNETVGAFLKCNNLQ